MWEAESALQLVKCRFKSLKAWLKSVLPFDLIAVKSTNDFKSFDLWINCSS